MIRVIVILLCTFSALAQGTFRNLDFEQAIVIPHDVTYGFLDWNLAAPGWTHSTGSDTSIIYYGSRHVGVSQAYLLMDNISPIWAPQTQLAGRYSLMISSGFFNSVDGSGGFINAFISQTGQIPDTARSVQLLADGPVRITVNGTPVPILSLGGNLYGGDVSAFAGSTAELKIINAWELDRRRTVLDNITFSPIPVPEPHTLVLMGFWGILLVNHRRRK